MPVLFCIQSFGQNKYRVSKMDTVHFSLTPARRSTVVNGVSVGLAAHPWSTWVDTLFVKINGFNLELGSFGFIGGTWGTMVGLVGAKNSSGKRMSFFTDYGYDILDKGYPGNGTYVNGFSISVGGNTETFNHGLFMELRVIAMK